MQLYVKGKLTNVEAVMIDIGTGYYIERVPYLCSLDPAPRHL